MARRPTHLVATVRIAQVHHVHIQQRRAAGQHHRGHQRDGSHGLAVAGTPVTLRVPAQRARVRSAAHSRSHSAQRTPMP